MLDLEIRLLELVELTREIRGHQECSNHLSYSVLSSREQEVARYLASGYSTNAAAKELHISVHTVRSHKRRIYEKLGVHSQAELIARLRNGE